MADYSVFSQVSNSILKLLRAKLSPEPIASPSMIEIASPNSKETDYTLGIYLYNLTESGEIVEMNRIAIDENTQLMPPKIYDLYYMIYVNHEAQVSVKEIDAHKILGKVAQVLGDNGILELPADVKAVVAEPQIQLVNAKLSMEDKSKIWASINKPYSLCLTYKAYPVYLSSEKIIISTRVTDASFHIRKNEVMLY